MHYLKLIIKYKIRGITVKITSFLKKKLTTHPAIIIVMFVFLLYFVFQSYLHIPNCHLFGRIGVYFIGVIKVSQSHQVFLVWVSLSLLSICTNLQFLFSFQYEWPLSWQEVKTNQSPEQLDRCFQAVAFSLMIFYILYKYFLKLE